MIYTDKKKFIQRRSERQVTSDATSLFVDDVA